MFGSLLTDTPDSFHHTVSYYAWSGISLSVVNSYMFSAWCLKDSPQFFFHFLEVKSIACSF